MSVEWLAKLSSRTLTIKDVIDGTSSYLYRLTRMSAHVVVALADCRAIRESVESIDQDVSPATELRPPMHFRLQLAGTAFAVDLIATHAEGPADDDDAGDWCFVDASAHRAGPNYVLALSAAFAIAEQSGTWVVDENNKVGHGRILRPADTATRLALLESPTSLEQAAAEIMTRTNMKP